MSAVDVVWDGSLLLAAPIAMAAGLVSFLSPCVLPLAPGYLAYVTGLTGTDLATARRTRAAAVDDRGSSSSEPDSRRLSQTDRPLGAHHVMDEMGRSLSLSKGRPPSGAAHLDKLSDRQLHPSLSKPPAEAVAVDGSQGARGRVVLGACLFVLGFTAVFVSYGLLFGRLGEFLLLHQRLITAVLGVLVIVLGLGFLGLGRIAGTMWWNRDRRARYRPPTGLWGAPLLGVVFALGWTPCIGPTLAAVQSLAFTEASAARGAVLSLAYCIGLGVPFVLIALGLRWGAGALEWTRAHHLLITRTGGVMLVVVGGLLVTGLWAQLVISLQSLAPGFSAVI